MKPLNYSTQQFQLQKPLLLNASHAESETRHFIADTFANHYNARIDTFCQQLVSVRNTQGKVCAAAGYNLAEEGPLFLEQYLDMPLEQHASLQLGVDIRRAEIAEVGNLAATQAGGARLLIELMTQHLYSEGRRWVAFTATRSLINSFHRLGLAPVVLATALAERVKNPQSWGTYYLQQPLVAIGDIHLGHARLGVQQ